MLVARLIETRYISSTESKSQFSEREIEELAHKILAANGVINPIVVKQVGPLSYAVVEGHFEFYAALRAKEINPGFEEIQVFILTDDPKINNAILEQVHLLRGKQPVNNKVASADPNDHEQDKGTILTQKVLDLDNRLKDLHSVIEEQKNYLDGRIAELIKLVSEIPDKIKASKDSQTSQRSKKKEKSNNPVKINSATLDELTNVTGVAESTALKIIDLREKHGSFKSFDDLLSKLKGVDKKRYGEIWQKVFVFE